MATRMRISVANLPMSSVGDGVPRQSVSSRVVYAAGEVSGTAVPAGEGRPQCGHAGASVETSRLQSGQAMTGMERFCDFAAVHANKTNVGRGFSPPPTWAGGLKPRPTFRVSLRIRSRL